MSFDREDTSIHGGSVISSRVFEIAPSGGTVFFGVLQLVNPGLSHVSLVGALFSMIMNALTICISISP